MSLARGAHFNPNSVKIRTSAARRDYGSCYVDATAVDELYWIKGGRGRIYASMRWVETEYGATEKDEDGARWRIERRCNYVITPVAIKAVVYTFANVGDVAAAVLVI